MDSYNKLQTLLTELNTNGGVSVFNEPLSILADYGDLNLNTASFGYVVGNNNHSQVFEYKTGQVRSLTELACAIYELWATNPTTQAVGLWLDKVSNRVYVDAIEVVDDLAPAMNLGASRGELAIWDISMKREIRL